MANCPKYKSLVITFVIRAAHAHPVAIPGICAPHPLAGSPLILGLDVTAFGQRKALISGAGDRALKVYDSLGSLGLVV